MIDKNNVPLHIGDYVLYQSVGWWNLSLGRIVGYTNNKRLSLEVEVIDNPGVHLYSRGSNLEWISEEDAIIHKLRTPKIPIPR